MFYFAVCDDERSFGEKEKEMITNYFQERSLNVKVDTFTSGVEIMALGERVTEYDALFLDVSMEQVNGIELANWIREKSDSVFLVFISGYFSYVFDGYKVGAARYILKDEEQFPGALYECLSYILKKQQEKLEEKVIDFPDKKMKLSVMKILYVESKLHKVVYYAEDKNGEVTAYSKYGKLDDVVDVLKPFGFVRTHQSYLVNMNLAENVERYVVTLCGGVRVGISKKYYKETENQFIKMQGVF